MARDHDKCHDDDARRILYGIGMPRVEEFSPILNSNTTEAQRSATLAKLEGQDGMHPQLIARLASIAVHVDEYFAGYTDLANRIQIMDAVKSQEVQAWLETVGSLAPRKR